MDDGQVGAKANEAGAVVSRAQGLWLNSEFLKLWIGQSVSMLGSRVSELALPLTAVLVLDASPLQMGLLSAMQPAAWLAVGLFAGVLVDRFRRRPIMILMDFGRAIALGLVPLCAVLGLLRMELLYVVALLVGVLTVFFVVAYQAYLPAVVTRQRLLEGNGRLEGSKSFAEIVGPGLGGALVQALTAPVAILVDACSFLISALSIVWIRAEEPRSQPKSQAVVLSIREGFRLIVCNPLLRSIALFSATGNLFSTLMMTLFTLFAIRELGFTADLLGVVLAVSSCAALPGAAFASWTVAKLGLGLTMILAGTAAGLGSALIPLAGGDQWAAVALLIVALGIFAFSVTLVNVNTASLRQAVTPDQYLGRVTATYRVIVAGTPLLGALLGGVLGELIGLRAAMAVGVIGQILAVVWLAFSPVARVRTLADYSVDK